MNKAKIHNDSLINNYLPADYLDSFSKEVVVNKNITPDTFFDMVFNRFPAWIDWLLKLRNKIVKPLGLDTTSRFPDSVCERSANEIIWGMPANTNTGIINKYHISRLDLLQLENYILERRTLLMKCVLL